MLQFLILFSLFRKSVKQSIHQSTKKYLLDSTEQASSGHFGNCIPLCYIHLFILLNEKKLMLIDNNLMIETTITSADLTITILCQNSTLSGYYSGCKNSNILLSKQHEYFLQ